MTVSGDKVKLLEERWNANTIILSGLWQNIGKTAYS